MLPSGHWLVGHELLETTGALESLALPKPVPLLAPSSTRLLSQLLSCTTHNVMSFLIFRIIYPGKRCSDDSLLYTLRRPCPDFLSYQNLPLWMLLCHVFQYSHHLPCFSTSTYYCSIFIFNDFLKWILIFLLKEHLTLEEILGHCQVGKPVLFLIN